MSRLIVKNLPAKASEADVRKHFEPKGRITDVRVMRKRDGSSRRFAFVGFTSSADAEQAASYFNMSYMLSSRLDVSLAKALGDEALERRKETLKRKRLEQREGEASAAKAKHTKPDAAPSSDAKLSEFLSVMQPQRTTAMWKNDNTDNSARPNAAHAAETRASGLTPGAGGEGAGDDDDDDVVDLRELQSKQTGAAAAAASDTEEADSARQDVPAGSASEEEADWNPQADESAADGADAPAEGEEISDMEWLRQRQTRIRENGEKPAETAAAAAAESEEAADQIDIADSDDNGPGSATPATTAAAAATPSDSAMQPTNRLFLRNLAYSVQKADLNELFAPFGVLKQIHIPIDPKTDKVKGIAFVEFQDKAEAASAHDALDGQSFQGRLLHIIYAQEQRSYQLDEFDIKNMPLKKQRALRQRMQAAKQQFAWNSLYLNKDTVLEATAAKLGITKSEMMDPTSSNMAVKQALAESSVLESVQTYFRSKGVDLAKFKTGQAAELSDNIILAKNLPYQTSAAELQDMFAEHGEVERTLMPPDGGIAIVQFKLASAGRAAFRKLAFRRVGESILYLQKAPKGVLGEQAISDAADSTSASATSAATGSSSVQNASKATSAKDMLLPDSRDSDAKDDSDVRTSIFVKNLSFSTTVASLSKLFQAMPGYVSAIIKQKPDPHNAGQKLSMGFGFVEFRTQSQANVALKALQGTPLDGHSLQLKISSRGAQEQPGKPAGTSAAATTSKIVIKNIPFETTKKDITDLFGTFGVLRSVRVPRKFNRQTRGFAFAEFTSPKEAEHAMASLQGAHLLGRRLVMDYAEADAEDAETEIARMEAKVARQVSTEQSQSGRLGGQQKGFDMDNLEG